MATLIVGKIALQSMLESLMPVEGKAQSASLVRGKNSRQRERRFTR